MIIMIMTIADIVIMIRIIVNIMIMIIVDIVIIIRIIVNTIIDDDVNRSIQRQLYRLVGVWDDDVFPVYSRHAHTGAWSG